MFRLDIYIYIVDIYLYHWEGKDSNLRQRIATEFTAQPAIPTNGTFLYI
jgi:hypothetical protein